MNTLLNLLLLFIIIIHVVKSVEAQCTPEDKRCCILLCIDPYCDVETGSCKCGNAQLSQKQCADTEDKCTADKIDHCCLRRCRRPYCDPETGNCRCGDNILSSVQCTPEE